MKTKLLLLHFLVPLFLFAQIQQIGVDIEGEAPSDKSGSSVSVSTDGSIVAIGAPLNDGNGDRSGHVRIYENIGGAWTQIGADIDGEAAYDSSGGSVSLSADGSIVAIGAGGNDENGNGSGHVRVYENTGGVWTQIGQDIDGEAALDNSGFSVSLSADGSILAIGAPFNDENGTSSGHVRIYQNTGGTWIQIGIDIDGESHDELGFSVSLSADGGIVAIGARIFGYVRVYENTGGTWIQIGADIEGEASQDWSGWSVSLSADGSIVAIGAYGNDGNGIDSGHVRIYQNTGGVWTQIGADIDGEAAGDNSGDSVSLSADGSIVAIGASGNDGNGIDSGHVRIYQNTGGTWTQIGADIDGEAAMDGAMGLSVSLSANGSTVAIGAPFNQGNGPVSGHVRVFDLSSVMGLDDNSLLDFSVYPSPTSGVLNIESKTTITQIEIYNQLGQLVLSNSNQRTIDISSVSQGLYFVKIMDENGGFGTQKVVKK